MELISRQIAAGRMNIQTAVNLIRENGFSRFSDKKVSNIKDGEEVYDTLSKIVSLLFDAGGLTEQHKITLKILALLEVRGLEIELLCDLVNLLNIDLIHQLNQEGWIYADHKVRVHPVIAETVRSWAWSDSISDVHVMELHKNIADIYAGMANTEHIYTILKEAESYALQHSRHFIIAMYYDLLSTYYDALLNGAYLPDNDQEAEILQNLVNSIENAIKHMELEQEKEQYLIQYYLSMASILIRSVPEYHHKAAELLHKINHLIEVNEPEYSANRCYFYMVSAWYFTLVEPDLEQTKTYTTKAVDIAKVVFSTELEIIDIIYIPAANCYFYHNDFYSAVFQVNTAIQICRNYPDLLPYIDKQAELMNCLLDIYFELQNTLKCRELILEIDAINEAYKDQGICREVSPEIREILMKS